MRIAILCMLLAVQPAIACQPRVEDFKLALPGAASRAEILRPPSGRVRGVMVLIHGSDVADLDNSIVGTGGRIVSTPLKDVAVAMACAGVATIRYDKRFVSGADNVDRTAFDKLKLQDFLADAGTPHSTPPARGPTCGTCRYWSMAGARARRWRRHLLRRVPKSGPSSCRRR